MLSALVPPASRPRIHSVSTGVRPPLSISTLARSPAVSFTAKELTDSGSSSQPSSSQSHSTTSSSPSSSFPSPAFILPPLPSSKSHSDVTRGFVQSMFPVLVSRTVDLWRAVRSKDGKHTTDLFSSPGSSPSSPRSSTETEYILPLSASPQKTAFTAADLDVPSRPQSLYRLVPFPSVHASLLFVIILFPISSALVFFCVSTLPITFAWPRTLSDLAQLGHDLSAYSRSGFTSTAHIVSVLVMSAVWKHAWSIPGSVLWNVLAGALFHPLLATLLMTVTTSMGSVFATLLATPLASVLTRAFPRPIELTRAALEGSSFSTSKSVQSEESNTFSVTTSSSDRSPAWVRLSILRLVGIVPWSALNIACGLTGVALRDCLAGAFIGCLPWTAVTCQIGDILQAVNKARTTATEVGVDDGISNTATVSSVLAQPSMIFELVFLTILSLAPILFRDRLRRLIPSSDEASTDVPETGESEEKEVTVRSSRRGRPNALELPSLDDEEKDLNPADTERRGRHFQRQRWTWKRLSMSVPRWNALNSPLRSSFAHADRDASR
ncbi:hypothetical protein ACEPAH_5912 [Sanghuangporus vaninii]